jgi:hypothetical protein
MFGNPCGMCRLPVHEHSEFDNGGMKSRTDAICSQQESVYWYARAELSPVDLKSLEDHLVDCGQCLAKLRECGRWGHFLANAIDLERRRANQQTVVETAKSTDQRSTVSETRFYHKKRVFNVPWTELFKHTAYHWLGELTLDSLRLGIPSCAPAAYVLGAIIAQRPTDYLLLLTLILAAAVCLWVGWRHRKEDKS